MPPAGDDDTTPAPDDDTPGCGEPVKPTCGDPEDADCDGWPNAEDCGPSDPWIHPGALEACGNAVDEDCDGLSLPCRREGEVLVHLDEPDGTDAAFTSSTPFAQIGMLAAFIGDENRLGCVRGSPADTSGDPPRARDRRFLVPVPPGASFNRG